MLLARQPHEDVRVEMNHRSFPAVQFGSQSIDTRSPGSPTIKLSQSGGTLSGSDSSASAFTTLNEQRLPSFNDLIQEAVEVGAQLGGG